MFKQVLTEKDFGASRIGGEAEQAGVDAAAVRETEQTEADIQPTAVDPGVSGTDLAIQASQQTAQPIITDKEKKRDQPELPEENLLKQLAKQAHGAFFAKGQAQIQKALAALEKILFGFKD